jgi:hypothetical protein
LYLNFYFIALLFNGIDSLLLEAFVIAVLLVSDLVNPIPLISVPNISFELATMMLIILKCMSYWV